MGAGVDAEVTTSTVPPSSGARAPASPTSPAADGAARAGEPVVANRTHVLHEASGLRLVFVVADKVEFAADEPIVLELVVENTAGRTRYLDSTQKMRFTLFPEHDPSAPVWTDGPCRASDIEDVETGALPLAPGEDARYVARYPSGDADAARWGEHSDCRVPAGAYFAAGQVAWCPDDALEPSPRPGDRPICDDDEAVAVVSEPLRVTIGA